MYLVPGLWGAPLSTLEGLIPPANTSIGVKLLPHQVAEFDESLNGEICEQPMGQSQDAEWSDHHDAPLFIGLDPCI